MEAQNVWEEKFNELQKERDALKKDYDELKKSIPSNKSLNKIEHSDDFWIDIGDKCHGDTDSIKVLVKNKIMTLNDTDKYGKPLMSVAAYLGCYEIVQFCINSGADMNIKCNADKTALDYAREGGYYHIEQLLIFSQMNVNIGNEIRNTSNIIHEQNGINENILNELSFIGKQSKELFEKILMELIINIITKKLSFSDNLLNLCWNILCRDSNNDPLSSDLWNVISSTCSDIIENGSKRDWYWLKSCVIPSTIWFKDIPQRKEEIKEEEKSEDISQNEEDRKSQNIDSKQTRYLYWELLKLVDIETANQLNKLEKDLNILANEHKNDWNKLTKWDIADEYNQCRQDVIPNGIVSRYTYNQLSESSGASFNSPKFYDYNQYLSQLVLLAQIVDEEFQRSVQDMFNIDKVTNEWIMKSDEKKESDDIGDGKIQYIRGPVKLIERARNKAQNDYVNEEYPASACVLDLNRCALIFNDISTLLRALELFVNKVKYYQSGCIIGIVRDKNGFIEYVKHAQYADIKLNVLIKGKHNNIIGEVQFLLQTMKEFKDKAHNLYAIQRQKESIETSVNKILPMLLDEDKQLFIAGNSGNVRKLCQIMVRNNKTKHEIMKIDKETGNTILHRICSLGHYKAFLFLKSILSKETFIQHVFLTNIGNQSCIEYCIRYSNVSIAKCLFEMKEIKQKYKDNDDMIFRICYFLFAWNKNMYLIDYLLSELNITNEKVQEMMNYEYPVPTTKYADNAITFHQYNIITEVIDMNKLKALQKLVSIIGEKVFVDNIFNDGGGNINGLEEAVRDSKIKHIEYILSFKEIKDKYLNDDNLLFRLLIHLFASYNQNVFTLVISELKLTNDKITSLIYLKYPKPTKQCADDGFFYHRYNIICRIVVYQQLNALKTLQSIIGEDKFIDIAFISNDWNKNGIEHAICNDAFDIIKYILSFKGIKIRYSNDMNLLFRLIFTLFVQCKKQEVIDYVLSELDIPSEKIQRLMTYQYPAPTEEFGDGEVVWHYYSIIGMIVYEGELESVKKIKSIIGDKVFVDGVFIEDGWGENAMQCGIQENKLDIMKFIMSVNGIKERLMENKDELWTLISTINANYNVSMATFVIKTLGISEAKLNELKSYRDIDITNMLNIMNK